jgi:hemolysin activation/secretion protein
MVAGLGFVASAAWAPDALAQATPGQSPAPSAPDAAPPQHFDILEFVVDGNTVLPVADVEEAIYGFMGEGRDTSDVDKARDALERLYRERGFQTVQVAIPRQGVENGIIHLQVTENPIGRLRVVDSQYHSLDAIKADAPSLAEGKVPNLNDVQNDVIALNQQPDLKVTPRLKAGAAPGTVDVDLEVEDKLPLHASVEINNQYNQQTSPLRLVSTVSYDNLWQLGHSLSFTYQVAPENIHDAQVFSGSYLVPLPREGLSFLLYGVKSDSDVAALAGTDVIGKGNIFGARAIINLPGSEGFYQSVTAGFDRKDLSQNVVTNGTPSQAPVLYYPFTVAYAPTWRDGDITTDASASLNFALPGIGNGSTAFDAQRFDALKQYLYAKVEFSHTTPFFLNTVLYGHFKAQMADGALLSSEQFSAGGENSVRGYLEAERLGDDGVEANVEWRSPSLTPWISPSVNDWHFLIFADEAALWLHQPLPGEQARFGLADAGLGTRFTVFDMFNGAVDAAFPLLDGAVTKAGDPRFHFRFWTGL